MKSILVSSFLFLCASIVHLVPANAAQFLPASDFYRAPVSPDAMKLDGDIVVTAPLMRDLVAKRATSVRAFLVVDLNRLSAARLTGLLKREYQLTARFRTEFTYGFQDVEVVGSSAELMRFLSNRFAQDAVLWAGKTSGRRYIESIAPFFDGSALGDGLSNKNRMHLDPLPLGSEPGREAPEQEFPGRGSEDPGTPAFLE